jgi:hypothetical protein
MEIKVREDIVKIIIDGVADWEWFYPHEVDKLELFIDKTWVEKIRRFHKDYFERAEFDTALGYLVFRDEDDNIVKVIAISLFADEFDPATPEIVLIDIDEWLSLKDDP